MKRTVSGRVESPARSPWGRSGAKQRASAVASANTSPSTSTSSTGDSPRRRTVARVPLVATRLAPHSSGRADSSSSRQIACTPTAGPVASSSGRPGR
jgi:hypothetical protein